MFTLVKMAATEGVPLLMRIVSASVSVSHRAARIARDILTKGDLGIVEKTGKNDLQTEADRSAQRCIIASLHKQFPKVPIFGEEELAPTEKIPDDFYELGQDAEVLKQPCPEHLTNLKDDEVVIWVDPLDGTKEYTDGHLDHVTVLIGIAVKGIATAGIINQPFYNFKSAPPHGVARCIWGVLGLGTFGFKPSDELKGKNDNIITTTRSHSDFTITNTVKACEPTDILRVGGAGHKVLLLIEKKAHAYVFASVGCKKWDTCAPEAILHALGGKLTDIHGKPILYHANAVRQNMGGILATIANHQWYVDKIAEKIEPETLDRFQSQKPPVPTLEATLSQAQMGVPDSVGADNRKTPTKTSNEESQQGEDPAVVQPKTRKRKLDTEEPQ